MKFKKIIIGTLILITILFNFQINSFATNLVTDNLNNNSIIDDIFFMFIPDNLIASGKTDITDAEKNANNNIIIGTTIFLFIYWLGLLFFYEKESLSFEYLKKTDEEIFKDYNPLLAGCIADSRNVLGRDVIAVILNLINKKIVKLDIQKSTNNEKSENGYNYIISRCKAKEHTMDNIEKFVHSWIFEDVYFEDEEINLVDRLKTISKQKETYKKFEKLNNITTHKLNEIGANKAKVPAFLKVYHILLMGIVLFLVSKHIITNGINIDIYYSTIIIFLLILAAVFLIIPFIVAFGYLILKIFAYFKRFINILNEHFTGQRIISTTLSVILIFGILIILTYIFAESKYLIFDILLIGMMLLIIKTDHLMLKNDKKILNDYYHIQYIKSKIEEYSLLDEKDIEHIVLWEYYLTYSISFGNSDKISDKIKKVYKDDKMILELQNYEFLYQISKSYLEVFWEMNFNGKKKKTQPDKIDKFYQI